MTNKHTTKRSHLHEKDFSYVHTENFRLNYFEYFNIKENKLSQLLNNRFVKIKKTGLPYRVINHWEKYGVIPNSRDSNKEWRKFNIVESIWLQVVKELRDFGFPLECIKKGYLKLSKNYADYKIHSSFPLLEYYIARIFNFKEPCYIIADSRSNIEPLSLDECLLNKQLGFLDNHIEISLHSIIKKGAPKYNLEEDYSHLVPLSNEEIKVLFAISNETYDSVTIKRKNGKINIIEWSEKMENNSRISDILKKGDYQDIVIKKENGQITYINQKRKIKV